MEKLSPYSIERHLERRKGGNIVCTETIAREQNGTCAFEGQLLQMQKLLLLHLIFVRPAAPPLNVLSSSGRRTAVFLKLETIHKGVCVY